MPCIFLPYVFFRPALITHALNKIVCGHRAQGFMVQQVRQQYRVRCVEWSDDRIVMAASRKAGCAGDGYAMTGADQRNQHIDLASVSRTAAYAAVSLSAICTGVR